MKRHVYFFFFFGAGRSLESGAYSTTIIFLKKKKKEKKKRDGYKGNYNHSLFKLKKIILWLCSNVISFLK